ncbi:MAG TPA: VOC family protein [Hyphomicrobiaceae bacterium]|nr:VOC family protein [Hyphomicrobiaceae bacterium]
MSTKIFVNLPVKDLKKSIAFFETLGFTFNPQFTDDNAACMVISEQNYAMLLTHEYFKTFATKPISDAHTSTEVLIALALESKAAVDDMVAIAVKAGGKEPKPKRDHGFMVQRTFEDLDGHIWEPFWMDPGARAEGMSDEA